MLLNPFSGKNELLVNSETSCSTDGNEITSVTDTDEPSCISRCDLTPECGYSFYGEDNSCSLYHTCDDREETTSEITISRHENVIKNKQMINNIVIIVLPL